MAITPVRLSPGTLLIRMPLDGVDISQNEEGVISVDSSYQVEHAPIDGMRLQPCTSLNGLVPQGVHLVANLGRTSQQPANLVEIDGVQTLITPSIGIPRELQVQTNLYVAFATVGRPDAKDFYPSSEALEAVVKKSRQMAKAIAPYVLQGAKLVWQLRDTTVGEIRRLVGPEYPLTHTHQNLFSRNSGLPETPYGRALISSLLSADTLIFHTKQQAQNFRKAVERVMEGSHNDLPYARPLALVEDGVLVQDAGSVRLVQPLAKASGIELDTERSYALTPEAQHEIERLRAEIAGKECVLINGRVEDAKNAANMIAGYEILLEKGLISPENTVLNARLQPLSVLPEDGRRVKELVARIEEKFGPSSVIANFGAYGHDQRAADSVVADVHTFVSASNPGDPAEGREGFGHAPLHVLANNPGVRCVVGPEHLTPVTEVLRDVAVIAKSDSAEDCAAALYQALQPETPAKKEQRIKRTNQILEGCTAKVWSEFVAENTRIHPVPQSTSRARRHFDLGAKPRAKDRYPRHQIPRRTVR